MKDFRLYDIADFAMDEDFIRWVQEQNERDNRFWEEWLEQNPAKQLVLAEARSIVAGIHMKAPAIDAVTIEEEIGKLLQHIREEEQVPVKRGFFTKKHWYSAAACLLVIVFGVGLLLNKKNTTTASIAFEKLADSLHLIKKINTTRHTLLLSLADGSTITLSPESSVSYAADFGKTANRDVYLSGEAFFNVTKNANAPFRVFAHEIITRVLGTSFSVRSFEKDAAIKVTVLTGKVSVYKRSLPAPGGIIVSCNQQLLFEKEHQKFDKMLSDNPVPVTGDTGQHSRHYENVSLQQVFSELGKEYGIYIMFDADSLKNCTINADLDNEPFYEKLNMICKAIGASYEVIDGQVIIQAGKCK